VKKKKKVIFILKEILNVDMGSKRGLTPRRTDQPTAPSKINLNFIIFGAFKMNCKTEPVKFPMSVFPHVTTEELLNGVLLTLIIASSTKTNYV
jgi:hypothetical protein